jgi:hypothetical protein
MDKLTFEKKPFYSPSEVSVLLDVHPTTVREWMAEGRLYGIRLSERVTRIPLGGLLEFLGQPLPVTDGEITPQEAEHHWEKAAAEHATLARRA